MNSVNQTGFGLGFFFSVGSSLDILCAINFIWKLRCSEKIQ